MKAVFMRPKDVWAGFCDWVKNNIIYSVFVLPTFIMVYYKFVTSGYFYVDSEMIINNPRGEYNWVETGRFGLPALKRLMGTLWYNPYFEAVLFIIALYLCCLVFIHLFCSITGKVSTIQATVFSLLLFVYPIYADLFYFQFFSFEVVEAYLFLAIAGCYFYNFLKTKNIVSALIALGLLVWSFGIYQNMVNLAICVYIAIYLLMITNGEKGNILFSIIHFLLALALYKCICMFFPQSSYLSGQIRWNVDTTWEVIRSLLSYIKQVLIGRGVFYTYTYLVVVIASFVYLIVKIVKKEKITGALIGLIGMLSSPFYLAIVMGGPSTTRAQLMVPFVGAFLWIYFSKILESLPASKNKILSGFWIVLGIVCMIGQLSPLMRLMYTQSIVSRDDDANARAIILDIEKELNGDALPVVFLGERKAVANGSTYTWDDASTYVAFSAFESGRIHGFLETIGYEYVIGSDEIKKMAVEEGGSLSNWPAFGSVKRVNDDFIVVKLSDSLAVE